VSIEPSGSSIPRRQLGYALRSLREQTGHSVEYAATVIERSRPTLWKIESGQPGVRIRNHDVRGLCELYGASTDRTDELLALAEATRVKGWTSSYADILPPNFDMYIGLEVAARRVFWYEDSLIPGVLQCHRYARALLELPGAYEAPRSEEAIERRLELRLQRQKMLTRKSPPPVHLDAVLGEAVLRRPLGGKEVMVDQLRHVRELSKLANVTIRVLPFSDVVHHGLFSGSFTLLQFPEGKGSPIVYADGFGPIQYFWDKPEDIARYEVAFGSISEHALDEESSRDLIEGITKELLADA
jgi:transcriptional regulator with XRE-family HTH domain